MLPSSERQRVGVMYSRCDGSPGSDRAISPGFPHRAAAVREDPASPPAHANRSGLCAVPNFFRAQFRNDGLAGRAPALLEAKRTRPIDFHAFAFHARAAHVDHGLGVRSSGRLWAEGVVFGRPRAKANPRLASHRRSLGPLRFPSSPQRAARDDGELPVGNGGDLPDAAEKGIRAR